MSTERPLRLEVLGTVFTVWWGAGVDAGQRESMLRAWSRCTVDEFGPSADAGHDEPGGPAGLLPFTAVINFESKLSGGGNRQLAATTFEQLAEQLTSEITLSAILERAGEVTMLHACGVADMETGAVTALVARSGTGKTTAATVLARTRGYVTDETVAIGPGGEVIAYPKPLSVKQAAAGASKIQVGPDQLGLAQPPPSLFISSIILLDRVRAPRERTAPNLQPIPLADAVLALIPDTSSQASIKEPLQSLCRLLENVGGLWRLEYSEAEDLPGFLEKGLAKPETGRASWSVPSGPVETGDVPPGHLRRTEPDDAVLIDGDLLVLQETEILRLSGIAPTIWNASSHSVTAETLAAQIGLEHGLPAGYREALDSAVDELVERGILVRG